MDMEPEKQERNTGLELLKIWMCFEVIVTHFKDWSGDPSFQTSVIKAAVYHYRFVAAPVFMMLSFCLVDLAAISRDPLKRKKRWFRLGTPQVFWALVYYPVYLLVDILKTGEPNYVHGVTDIFWELILGHSYNTTMWYQVNLIFLTLLFLMIFRLLPRGKAVTVSLLAGMAALALQYSGINARLFDGVRWPETIWGRYFSASYVNFPIGRIAEMIPLAAVGILVHYTGFLERCRKSRWSAIPLTIALLWLLFRFDFFIQPKGYSYSGVFFIAAALCTIALFYCLPLEWLPGFVRKLIHEISGYTLGIYCIHRLMQNVLAHSRLDYVLRLREFSLKGCVILFAASYAAVRCIGLIPCKWIRAAVK